MRKIYMWGCLTLLLAWGLAYRQRNMDLRHRVAAKWPATAGDVTEVTFSPNFVTDHGNSGSVMLHHSRWDRDEWLGYRVVSGNQIHITGPGTNDLWDMETDGCGSFLVTGSNRGVGRLGRGGGCIVARASSERIEKIKDWWQRVLTG